MKNLKNNSVNNLSLDQEINNIAQRLSLTSPALEVVKTARPSKGDSAVGIINIFNKAEHEAQTKEKPAKPTTRYVFYSNTYRTKMMGSVAIYSRNPMAVYSLMRNRNSLFGHRIMEVSLEKGLSTYVDVKFAA